MAEPAHSARLELHRLVDLLSDYECAHLQSAVSDIVCGERFREGDSGLFYNEEELLGIDGRSESRSSC